MALHRIASTLCVPAPGEGQSRYPKRRMRMKINNVKDAAIFPSFASMGQSGNQAELNGG